MGVHPPHVHIPEERGGVPERRLGPVRLHLGVCRPVGLVPPGVVLGGQGHGHRHLHPKLPHGLEGHLDIALALQGGGGDDGRRAVQQGQGEQQPGEKLGGHVPRQAVLAGGEHPGHGELAVLLLVENTLFVEEVKVGLQRPLHQPPPAGENAAPPNGQRHGDQEA